MGKSTSGKHEKCVLAFLHLSLWSDIKKSEPGVLRVSLSSQQMIPQFLGLDKATTGDGGEESQG